MWLISLWFKVLDELTHFWCPGVLYCLDILRWEPNRGQQGRIGMSDDSDVSSKAVTYRPQEVSRWSAARSQNFCLPLGEIPDAVPACYLTFDLKWLFLSTCLILSIGGGVAYANLRGVYKMLSMSSVLIKVFLKFTFPTLGLSGVSCWGRLHKREQ